MPSTAFSPMAISDIICLRSHKKMFGVAAQRNIAGMTDNNIRSKWAINYFSSCTMGVNHASFKSEMPIPVIISRFCPQPTFIRFPLLNIQFKNFRDCKAHFSSRMCRQRISSTIPSSIVGITPAFCTDRIKTILNRTNHTVEYITS